MCIRHSPVPCSGAAHVATYACMHGMHTACFLRLAVPPRFPKKKKLVKSLHSWPRRMSLVLKYTLKGVMIWRDRGTGVSRSRGAEGIHQARS